MFLSDERNVTKIKNFVTFVNSTSQRKRQYFLISNFVENIKLRIPKTKGVLDENRNESK